jgi:hypothetical protein
LPSNLIATFATIKKNPALRAGFFVDGLRRNSGWKAKGAGNFPPLYFYLQIALAMMAPVVVVPTMMVPVAVMPMMVIPMMMVPVTVMMVAHLHGLHLIDFVLRHDRRNNGYRRRYCRRLDRRHGRSLCACSKQERACNQSSAELQEIPKFHNFMPL